MVETALQNLPPMNVDPAEQRRNIERFGELVLADPALHAQLRATRDVETFAVLSVQLGAERNCVFTLEAVRNVLNERRRVWLERWIL